MDASSKAEVMERYVEARERHDWEAATAIWADDCPGSRGSQKSVPLARTFDYFVLGSYSEG
jgi:hypothetical protein